MTLTRHLFVSIVLLSILAVNNTVYADNDKFVNGTVTLKDKLSDGTLIKIIVSATKYSSSFPYADGFVWGAESGWTNPKFVITKVNVNVGDKKVFVPLSAYCDLANPRDVLLTVIGSNFTIIIIGGDAATSYKAELKFEGRDIRSRKVVHGEMSDVREETVYSFISADDAR